MIGKIPYSLTPRLSNPTDKKSEKRVYPSVQRRDVISLEELAKHIREHGSVYSEGTILGVMTDMITCTVEQICAGYKVDLGRLGRVGITLLSDGVNDVDDFIADVHIKKVKPLMTFSDYLVTELQNADFELVSTRDAQREALKAEKADIATELGGTNTDDGGTTDPDDPDGDGVKE